MAADENDGDRDKRFCGGRKRQGEGFCTRPAGWGTDHPGVGRCKLHGGSTRTHRDHARAELAKRAAVRLGIAREVDAAQALLELVFEAAGNVEFYRDLVGQLAIHPPVHGDEAADETAGGEGDSAGIGAIYGRTYHQSGVPTGEAKRHILVQLYDDERDRLKEYAATVVKVGLAEREVRIAEVHAALVARVVMAVLDDPELALTREQREMGRRIGGRHLRQLSAGGTAA